MSSNPTLEASNISRAIVIVGGGLSGALVAIQLLRRSTVPVSIVVIEPRSELGRGVAYSTSLPSHLLNVRAGNMSIFPEELEDFLNYLRSEGSPEQSPRAFIERQRFGTYVSRRLVEARSKAAHGISFKHVRKHAQRIHFADDGRASVATEDGSTYSADAVVIALGNNPPAIPFKRSDDAELLSGWSPEASEGVASDEAVLIVGSGLTAVDAVLALDDRGHRGNIHVVSRHGRWPLVHGSPPPSKEAPLDVGESSSVLTILRTLRAKVRHAAASADSWQATFDQIRPYTNLIWKRLTISERRRFLRHARPLWEIHRHRMPPEVAARLEELTNRGQLVKHRGRVLEASRAPDGLTRVAIEGNTGRWDLPVRRVIVCTGPNMDFRKSAQPLISNLVQQDLAQLDPGNLGLLVAEDYSLMKSNGAPSSSLFALGPIIKGSLWETTALPEIRVQASDLVTHLMKVIGGVPISATRGIASTAS